MITDNGLFPFSDSPCKTLPGVPGEAVNDR